MDTQQDRLKWCPAAQGLKLRTLPSSQNFWEFCEPQRLGAGVGEAPGQPSLPRVGSALVSPMDMSHYGKHVTSPHLCWGLWGLLREPSGMA